MDLPTLLIDANDVNHLVTTSAVQASSQLSRLLFLRPASLASDQIVFEVLTGTELVYNSDYLGFKTLARIRSTLPLRPTNQPQTLTVTVAYPTFDASSRNTTLAPTVAHITSPARAGRAMAIVFAGTSLGLAAGAPLGTLLGEALGLLTGFLGLTLLPPNFVVAIVLLGIWSIGYAAAAVFNQQVILVVGHGAPDTVTSVSVVVI